MFLLGKQSISRVVEADREGEGEDGSGWGLGPTLPLCFHFLLLSVQLPFMAFPLPSLSPLADRRKGVLG